MEMNVAVGKQGGRRVALFWVGCVLVALPATPSRPGSAQEFRSIYTRFDSKQCHHVPGKIDEDYGSWTCPGLDHLPIVLMAADQRMNVTFGLNGKNDLASFQTLSGFNDVYSGVVEWRVEATGAGEAHPVATILRWNVVTSRDLVGATGPVTTTGRVLVVTRVGRDGTCHVGYVDARRNANANELARQIADQARSFRCGRDRRKTLGVVDPDLPLPTDE